MKNKNWMLKAAVMLIAPLLLQGCADLMREKSQFQAGVLADIQSNITTAERQALQGDVRAQLQLGRIYSDARYYLDSFVWFQKAAEKGNAEAQYRLGQAYQLGQGTQPDIALAVEWYKKSADQHNEQALKALESLDGQQHTGFLRQGDPLPERDIQSLESEKMLPEQVVDPSEVMPPLSQPQPIYDTEPDSVKTQPVVVAKKEVTKTKTTKAKPSKNASVKKSSPSEEKRLEAADLQKEPVTQGGEKGSKGTIAELKKAAEAGDVNAQLELSMLFLEGKKVSKDLSLSAKYAEMAAKQGHAVAQNNLGAAYTHGHGVEQDRKKAFEWYEKAAMQGYPLAQYNLGAAYAMGAGVEKDLAQAYAWFSLVSQVNGKDTQAAEQGEINFVKLDSTLAKLESILSKNGQLEQAMKLLADYTQRYSPT